MLTQTLLNMFLFNPGFPAKVYFCSERATVKVEQLLFWVRLFLYSTAEWVSVFKKLILV